MNSNCYTETSLPKASIAYSKSGAICIRGAFKNEVETLRIGVDRLLQDPGPFASEHSTKGRFFEDYCNWERIEQFKSFILHSKAGEIAATLLSSPVQFFHDHVVVKTATTSEPTPWHQDISYFPVDAPKNVSFWVALDSVPHSVCPQFIEGSHALDIEFAPRSFNDGRIYSGMEDEDGSQALNHIVKSGLVLSWSLEPGDIIAFSFKTVHGAPS